MNELFSRPVSPEAREKLTAFIEAYVNTLTGSFADETAEIAKRKAIEVLATDIDILVFVMAVATMSMPSGLELAACAVAGKMEAGEVAVHIVRVMEDSIRWDKASRAQARTS